MEKYTYDSPPFNKLSLCKRGLFHVISLTVIYICKARSGPSSPMRLSSRYLLPDSAKPSTVPHSPPMMWVSWEMLSLMKMASHSSPPR